MASKQKVKNQILRSPGEKTDRFYWKTTTLLGVKIRWIDQKLDEHIKSKINRSKLRSTDQKKDEWIESFINRLKAWSHFKSTDENLDQQIDSKLH